MFHARREIEGAVLRSTDIAGTLQGTVLRHRVLLSSIAGDVTNIERIPVSDNGSGPGQRFRLPGLVPIRIAATERGLQPASRRKQGREAGFPFKECPRLIPTEGAKRPSGGTFPFSIRLTHQGGDTVEHLDAENSIEAVVAPVSCPSIRVPAAGTGRGELEPIVRSCVDTGCEVGSARRDSSREGSSTMRRNPIAILWLAAGLVVGSGCVRLAGGEKDEAKGFGEGGEKKEEAVLVDTVTLSRGPVEAVLRLSSNLEAERAVTVFSQAPRLVRELLVEEGRSVFRGDVLLRLQDDEQRLALRKAESRYHQAREEFERQQKLFKQQLAPEQVFIDARHSMDQAEMALDEARQALSYTEVRAPITGVVTERLVNLGDSVTINQALFKIVDFDSIIARIYVPEKDLRRLDVGQPARIIAAALGETPFAGRVLRISPVVDPKTGTVKVTVAVPNQPGLRPGLFVDVELITDVHPEALLIPKRALVYDNDRIFTFRIDEEHRARRCEVEILLEDSENVEPVEGFSTGDILVVAGQAGLKDGTLIRLPGEKEIRPGESVGKEGPENSSDGDGDREIEAGTNE